MGLSVPVLDDAAVLAALSQIDVAEALRQTFAALYRGEAVQPPQTLTLFPGDAGDFITYSGAIAQRKLFGAKLSPYIARTEGALVTAWTLLMSMETGEPLLLCDAKRLTTERTAATTALAVDLLSEPDARNLAIIGAGPAAEAHLRHTARLRDWRKITVCARRAKGSSDPAFSQFFDTDGRVKMSASVNDAIGDADVVLLCTSSAVPVLELARLERPALITSISTNAPRAHEIDPAALSGLDVFCDYRVTAPLSAGEMVIAQERHGWSPSEILSDLPELVGRGAPPPVRTPGRHLAFFRSIGLGLEDIAVAAALHDALVAANRSQPA